MPVHLLNLSFRRRLAVFSALARFLVMPAAGDAPPMPKILHLKGVILTPDGKPAAEAVIFYDLVDSAAHSVASEDILHPAATGAFDIVWTPDPKAPRFPVLYVSAPEGVAVPALSLTEMNVTLTPATNVRVHLLDEAGKPIARVRVCPQSLQSGSRFSAWNEAVTSHLSAVTDEAGWATLTGLPQGSTLRLDVADPSYVPPDWSQNIALAKAAVTPDATLKVARGGALSGAVVFGMTKQPAAGYYVSAVPVAMSGGGERQTAFTDAEGRYQMGRLPAGTYNVSVGGSRAPAAPEWTAVQQSAVVVVGKEAAGTNFTLIHGGVLTGTVTDPKTGKPIPQVSLLVIGPAGDQYANTDEKGRYTLHLPPGYQQVMLAGAPGMTQAAPQTVELADGDSKTLNFLSRPPVRPAVVRGIVVGPTGKPVAGAQVTAVAASQQEQDAKQTTDAQGKFTFDNPPIMPDMSLYAVAGTLGTPKGTLAGEKTLAGENGPLTLEKGALTLTLAPGANAVVQGRVLTPEGKPLPKAGVMLFRQNVSGPGGIGIDTAMTDAAGRYHFTLVVPDATYSVEAHSKGFGSQFTKQAKASAGKPLTFAALKLPQGDSFVGGTVVDQNGQPIEGADVRSMGSGDDHALTDKQGRFHLQGATRGKAILEVQAAGGRFASIQVVSGRDDDVITAQSEEERMAESKRFVALRDADTTNHGHGENAAALLHSAFQRAGRSSKKVLLVFHASWCGPCFLLHRFLEDPAVKPVMDAHFITQDLDIWEDKPTKAWENPGGVALYNQYGGRTSTGKTQGVPFFAVLDGAGKKLGDARLNGENIGYPSDSGSAAFFLRTLKCAAPDLTGAELAVLKAGLQRHAKI